MHSGQVAALCAFFAAVAAVPMKRDIEINTVTEIDIVTEVVTATVWVDATGATEAVTYKSAEHTPEPWYYTTSAAPIITTSAAPTTSSSLFVAATPTSTSSSISTTTTSSSSSTYVAPAVYTPPVVSVAPVPTTTSSVYVAPVQPTTSTSVETTPIPAYTPPVQPTTSSTTTSPAAAVTATSSGGSGDYSGDITYYDVGLGSCGNYNTDSESVVAMAHGMMNKATMCGKTITISYQGSTHQATVVDTCMSCVNGDLDLSPSLFQAIAPNGDGRVHGVSWSFT